MQDSALAAQDNLGYDQSNRLRTTADNTWNGTAGNFGYSYDRYGNCWTKTVTGGSGPQPSFAFSAATNQIPTPSGYTYDAAGNMTRDGTGVGFHAYTYDANGNITAAVVIGGGTAKYTYNALNQRVRVDTGSTAAEFLFNPAGQRVCVWDGNTYARVRGQYYWAAMPVAYYTSDIHFQHQGYLGTARLQTSYNGAVEASYTSGTHFPLTVRSADA